MDGKVIDFKSIIEYARRFPEMRMIDSKPIDVTRTTRSGAPLDGPVSDFAGISTGDAFGDGWTVTAIALRRGEIDVSCRGPDGLCVTFIIGAASDGPPFPFDIPAARIGYRETDVDFDSLKDAGHAFAELVANRVKQGDGHTVPDSWNDLLARAAPAPMEPDPRIVEIRPDGKVYVRMTEKCQERCVFCFFYDTPQERDLAAVGNLDAALWASLEQIDPATTTQLILTGGEPLLLDGFDRMLRMLLDRGFANIVVQTNGILPSRLGLLERFAADRDRLSFGFSLHAASAAVSGMVTGTAQPGLFEQKLASIRQAVDLGYLTKITCVLTSFNLHELQDIVRLCASMKMGRRGDNVILQFSMPAIKGLMSNNRDACPTLADVRRSVPPALALADREGLRTSFSSLCSVPPCSLPDNLKHLETMWYRHGAADWWETERVFGHGCATCALKNWCSGVSPAYLEWFGDGELVPFDARDTTIVVPD